MNENGITVLSLCDGMSCGHIALKELGITVDSYYASEIDKNSIKVTQDNFPDTKQLGDVLESQVDEKYFFKEDYDLHGDDKRVMATLHINGHDIIKRVYNRSFKAPTLTSCRGGNRQVKVMDGGRVRRLTPLEYRRLQTIPDWVKMDVANSHIYNMLGDGWTVEVIKHIFNFLPFARERATESQRR